MPFSRSETVVLALCAILLGGCRQKSAPAHPTVDFVQETIAGKHADEAALVRGFKPGNSKAEIVLFGPVDEVNPLYSCLKTCDMFDNVDARPVKDLLPDFAGETFAKVVVTPKYFEDDDQKTAFRTRMVKAVVNCIDTVAYKSSAGGVNATCRKPGKIVVMTSSEVAESAAYDIDSLFRAFSVESPVVYPLDLMVDKLRALGFTDSKVAVVSDKDSTLYAGYLKDFVIIDKDRLAVSDSLNVVDSLGVSSILLDDYTVSADSVRMKHPGYFVVSPAEATAEKCFRELRRRNAFTHRIAYPDCRNYVALPGSDGQYMIVDSNDRIIQD